VTGIKNRFIAFFGRYPNLTALAVIALAAAAAYANAVPNSFHFDDIEGIVQNPIIRDIRRIPAYFFDMRLSVAFGAKDYRPIILTSYALDYSIAGLNVAVFRVTNFLIHLATAWLLFLITARIFAARPIPLPRQLRFPTFGAALLAAVLFAVHTANSEAVDYIWSRSATLATLFYLASLYCFLRGPLSGDHAPNRLWHIAGLAFFALGLGTKATIVTLPAALMLYETLFLRPSEQEPLTLFFKEPRRLKKYIPIVVVFASYFVLRLIFLRGLFTRAIAGNRPEEIAVPTYLLTQFRAWVYYIRLFFWPQPLITDYPGFGLSHSLADGRVLAALAIIAVIVVLALRVRRSLPAVTFFAGFYFLVHVPESSFIPLNDILTGYRAYPANLALAALTIVLTMKAAARIWPGGETSRFWLGYGSVATILILALIGATLMRNRDWRDESTLWTDVIRKDPTNSRAYVNLAREHIAAGDSEKARALLEQAIALEPKKSFGYMFRGYLSLAAEKNEEALADLSKAVEFGIRNPKPYYLRAEIYRKIGEYDKALSDYNTAIARNAYYTEAYLGMALVHMDKGDSDKAATACTKITELDPREARGHNCLGLIFLEKNDAPNAIRAYQRGVIHAPLDSGLWYGLGLAYEKSGMYREASEAFDRSSQLTK
jgi:protein O-mannosyl-transferase